MTTDAISFRSHRERSWEELLIWLHTNNLTFKADALDLPGRVNGFAAVDQRSISGFPLHRQEGRTRAELQNIQSELAGRISLLAETDRWNAVWSELRDPDQVLRDLDVARIPADAIAFYRSFHIEPMDQWGIYIVLPRLLDYASLLNSSLGQLRSLDPSVLASLVLFDVFHHEFFHHMVESMATAVEAMWPTLGRPTAALYLAYRTESWRNSSPEHPHDPLEEALANAYSYNSFSFISRVQGGYLSGISKIYQRALLKSWPTEPTGYRNAGSYLAAERLDAARILLERILGSIGPMKASPLGILVNAVFPRGHTAFWAKPDIPTYLVGSTDELGEFLRLVPAPCETYSSLYWPGDTARLDAFLKLERAKERQAKRASRRRGQPG